MIVLNWSQSSLFKAQTKLKKLKEFKYEPLLIVNGEQR